MKFFKSNVIDFVSDVAVVVGTAVGVGLISGKETQVFVGGYLNAAIFFLSFCVIICLFRIFCRRHGCVNLSDVTGVCFKRSSGFFNAVITLCSFVCVVTCLAGAESCLSEIVFVSRFPLYSIAVAALCTLLLLKGMSALKACNAISVVMSLALIVILFVEGGAPSDLQNTPKAYMPVAYALFTFTMSISVTCRMGSRASVRQNVLRTVFSGAVITAMLIATGFLADFTLPLPTLSAIQSLPLKIYAAATVTVAAVGSIVGCAYPVVEQLDAVVGDKTLSSACVFCLAVAFSMFGFDFVITYGYALVALVGLTLVAATQLARKRNSLSICNL